jgi:hypothetical protein
VQTGWQTSSGRLAAADSGWFGCETADVVAKRWVRPTQVDASGRGACRHEPRHERPGARSVLKLGRRSRE